MFFFPQEIKCAFWTKYNPYKSASNDFSNNLLELKEWFDQSYRSHNRINYLQICMNLRHLLFPPNDPPGNDCRKIGDMSQLWQ